jgi:hypothetical protein
VLGVPANRISAIVAEKRDVTADTALRLARAFKLHRSSGSTPSRPSTYAPQSGRLAPPFAASICAGELAVLGKKYVESRIENSDPSFTITPPHEEIATTRIAIRRHAS